MAGLADLVLSAGGTDEFEVEDEDLIRQIEELKALRESVNPGSSSDSCMPGVRSSTPAKVSAGYGTASLADKILASSDGADDIDQEFQAMEQELQEQMLKYKEQCQASQPATPAAVTAQDASTTAGSTSWPSRPSSKSSALGKEPASGCLADPEVPGVEAITPELLELRENAAKMEEAFPDAPTTSPDVEEKPRNRRIRRVARETVREECPEDQETADMKQMLAGLDVRMSAIQQRHALHDPLEHTPQTSMPPAAARAVSELRAQNAYLRERFQSTDKKGLLDLDPKVFGIVEKAQKATGAVHSESKLATSNADHVG
jgi:hypothetical protein